MNYELAKKLKDAGLKFALGRIGAFYWQSKEGIEVEDARGVLYSTDRQDIVCIPSLKELIKACFKEKEIFNLHYYPAKEGKKWLAYSKGFMQIDGAEPRGYAYIATDAVEASGTSPEEAVANLWLKLNAQ